LLTGTEVRLSDGPLADAVLAAAAIPGVLPPVRWRGRLLADGGIADNTPVWHAVALGARRIYVLPTQNPRDPALPCPPRGGPAPGAGPPAGRRGPPRSPPPGPKMPPPAPPAPPSCSCGPPSPPRTSRPPTSPPPAS